jgi:8-oxo-dGTP diphosphatase
LAEVVYCTEATVGEHTRDLPLSGALVVLFRGLGSPPDRHSRGDRVLLVDNRLRDCWEIPGGHIDPGESARAAAVRELREESGLDVPDLTFGFLSHVLLGPYSRDAWDAVYVGRLAEGVDPPPFTPNSEIAGVCWWRVGEPLERLAPLDAKFAELAVALSARD